MSNINIQTISVTDNQSNLSNKLNYNFHLLSDYINGVKTIKGERGPQGIPGPQGAAGERGEKGDSVLYCPYSYTSEQEDFKKWCIDNNVSSTSVIIDADGLFIGCTKDVEEDDPFDKIYDKTIDEVIKDSIDESVGDMATEIFKYLSEDSPLFLSKYLTSGSGYNKGLVLSNNYSGKENIDVANAYISLFRYSTDYNRYSPNSNNSGLNGIVFGCNNYSDIETDAYFRLTYDTYTDGKYNYISELLFSHIQTDNKTHNITGVRYLMGNSSLLIGSGDYISFISDNIINNDSTITYKNAVSLFDKGYTDGEDDVPASYMFLGYGLLNSTEDISVLKSSSQSLTFELGAGDSSQYIFTNSDSNDNKSSLCFDFKKKSLSIIGKTHVYDKSVTTFNIFGGGKGTPIVIKGGDLSRGKKLDGSKTGSVVIKGGDVDTNFDQRREYALGGSVFIKGGKSNLLYDETSNKFGSIYIISGDTDKNTNYIKGNDSSYNSVIIGADRNVSIFSKDTICISTTKDFSKDFIYLDKAKIYINHSNIINFNGKNTAEFSFNSKSLNITAVEDLKIKALNTTIDIPTGGRFKINSGDNLIFDFYQDEQYGGDFKLSIPGALGIEKLDGSSNVVYFLGDTPDTSLLSITGSNVTFHKGSKDNTTGGNHIIFDLGDANIDSEPIVFSIYSSDNLTHKNVIIKKYDKNYFLQLVDYTNS